MILFRPHLTVVITSSAYLLVKGTPHYIWILATDQLYDSFLHKEKAFTLFFYDAFFFLQKCSCEYMNIKSAFMNIHLH